jgi:hypothetical protein
MDYIYSIKFALEAAQIRLSWYEQTGELRYLTEAFDWISVAKIYNKTELNYNGGSCEMNFTEAA